MKIYISYSTTEGLKTELFQKIDAVGLQKIMEGFKHEIISILKPLESEIDSEDGMIILNEDGEVDVKGFSSDLDLRINNLLFRASHK